MEKAQVYDLCENTQGYSFPNGQPLQKEKRKMIGHSSWMKLKNKIPVFILATGWISTQILWKHSLNHEERTDVILTMRLNRNPFISTATKPQPLALDGKSAINLKIKKPKEYGKLCQTEFSDKLPFFSNTKKISFFLVVLHEPLVRNRDTRI